MNFNALAREVKPLLLVVLSGRYSPIELKKFIELCYFLALPFVRKKIALGKFNPGLAGLSESDIVYDCLAELFQRDREGSILRLVHYCELLDRPVESMPDADVLIALRRLLFGVVNNGLIRVYGEIDPVLAKILRNIRLGVERSELFDQVMIFGEPHLVPRNLDPLSDRPFYTFADLESSFSRFVSLSANVPAMVKKLYQMLLSEERFRRVIATVQFGLLLKEIYSLSWDSSPDEATRYSTDAAEHDAVNTIVRNACRILHRQMYDLYVTSGKKSERVFAGYIWTVEEILLQAVRPESDLSYEDLLRKKLPEITRSDYREHHREALEYMVRVARGRIGKTLDAEGFRGQQ